MEYVLIGFVVFGVIVNFIMVNKKISNEIRVVNSKIKWIKEEIQRVRKFVNMPDPIEPPEED